MLMRNAKTRRIFAVAKAICPRGLSHLVFSTSFWHFYLPDFWKNDSGAK